MMRVLLTVLLSVAVASSAPAWAQDAKATAQASKDDKVKAEEIDSRSLIAALPSEVQCALVYRYDALRAEGSALAPAIDLMLQHYGSFSGKLDEDIYQAVMREAAKAKLRISVTGGSDFAGPPPGGIGAGSFDERTILVTESPLTEFRTALTANDKVVRRSENELTVFEGTTRLDGGKQVAKYVTFVDDHTVVIADKLGDARQIVAALESGDKELPPALLKIVATAELEAPLLALRTYDSTNENDMFSPVNPRMPEARRVAGDGYSAWISDVNEPTMRVSCITEGPDKMQALLSQFISIRPPQWQITPTDNGFDATIDLSEVDQQRMGMIAMLSFRMLFGQYLAV